MTRRDLVRWQAALWGCALAASIAGCRGGDDDGGGDNGDEVTDCQIFWASTGSNAGRYDIYILDMPIENWTSGEKGYGLTPTGKERLAYFFDEYDVDSDEYVARAVTTGGTFSVTTDSTAEGSAVALTDSGGQVFFEMDGDNVIGAQVGSGGAASFEGVWSDPDPDVLPTPGDGQVILVYHGTSLTIGTHTLFGICYDRSQTAE